MLKTTRSHRIGELFDGELYWTGLGDTLLENWYLTRFQACLVFERKGKWRTLCAKFSNQINSCLIVMGTDIHVKDLPETIVLKIFSFVAGQRIFNLFRTRLVCKRWCRLSEDCSLWRKICFPNCDDLSLDVLRRILSWCSNVKVVNLSNCGLVNDECVEVIAKKCPSLEVFELSGCKLLTDCGLEVISKNCSKLIYLSITAYIVNVSSNALKDLIRTCKALQELKVVCVSRESEEDAIDVKFFLTNNFLDSIQTSKSLKRLHLLNAGIIGDEIDLSRPYSFDLRGLGLPGCVELTNDVLCHFCYTSPKLQVLDVSYSPGIDDVGISVVAQVCPSLVQLIAKSCPCITDVSIEAIAEHCSMLQCLNVCGCELPRPAGNITDVAVQRIAEKCLDLRQLNVKSCQGVTDLGISAIATNCVKLTHLNICGCLGISDVSVKLVATFCNDLKSLEMSECLRITRDSINGVVQNCVKLEYLDMQVCSYVHDLDFKSDENTLLDLRHVDLAYCTKITDRTLKVISKSCPRLTYLSIAGCHRITDTGVTRLVQNCCELQYLDASFRGSQSCAQITSTSVLAIAMSCPNLLYLDLIGCSNISEASIEAVVQSCRYLKQLNVSQFTEKIDSQLLLRLIKCISQYRSSCSCEEMISPPRGRKLVQNFLFKMAAPNL